jgi:hypothetical protein
VEQRTIWVSGELAGWRGWPGFKTACMIERQTWNRTPDSYQRETAYLIGSMAPGRWAPATLLALNRGHWGIENRLHYVRDVTMGEDACRVRTKSAPQVLAGLRNAVLGRLRLAGWDNIAAALRHYSVKVSEALKLLGITEN